MGAAAGWLIGWRLLWAVLSRSQYVPDETWQSVEVAHRMVWGTGHLTWEWEGGLRSSLLPGGYAALFLLLRALRLDYQWLVVLLPRLVTGLVTALADLALLRLARRREGAHAAAWLLLLTQSNWFLLYSGSRTLSTTLEASLLQLALSCYPSPHALGLAALSVMLRPTAALAWLPLAPLYCLTTLPSLSLRKVALLPLLPLSAVFLAVAADSLYYGALTLTPWNFFRSNVLMDLSSFYGSSPALWYLSHALLPILGPLLLPALLGLPHAPALISLPAVSTLLLLSLLPHKEMRFLHSALPLLLYSAARWLARYTRAPPSPRSSLLLLLLQLPLALYLSLAHQQGTTAASLHLGQRGGSALFLLPCHSAPLYSHVHTEDSLRFLTCRPPLPGEPEEEAELFFRAPVQWLDSEYPLGSPLPDNVLLFSPLEEEVGSSLRERGLGPCTSWHHTHFPAGRLGERILLYCRERPAN